MTVTLVWFRNDLRLADHPALHRAAETGDPVVPVYIHDPPAGAPWAPGAASAWWLHHSLEALALALRECGSRLTVRRGETLQVLQELVRETGAGRVLWNRRYEPALAVLDERVETALAEAGIEVGTFPGNLLCEPDAIAATGGRPYRVFTPFWSACRRQIRPQRPLPAPRALAPGPLPSSAAVAALALLPESGWDAGLQAAWLPGENAACRRLDAFCAHGLAAYPQDRDRTDADTTSRLSPALHFGEVSPRQVLWAVDRAMGDRPGLRDADESFLRQLGWREFAHHLLYHYPHTGSQPLDRRFARFPWRDDYTALLRAWQRGVTGYPIVDAGLRQLWSTGWMPNRVRMLAASLLTKNLRVPWQEGARWFWDTLVDADLANNTLGWQWVAGCGADAAPYFRIFNPVRQGTLFDPDGVYVQRWVPELARLPERWLHHPWAAPDDVLDAAGVRLDRDYPRPIVDLSRSRDEALSAYASVRAAAVH